MSQSQRQASWRQGPSGPPRAYREGNNRHRNDLVLVDSMALQTVKITGSNKVPGLSVHSDSSGGGRQLNIYTKLAEAKSTICFKVDSEDAALQAYRQVRDMNPSAPVGGIIFSVAPKADNQFVDVKTIDWSSMVAPRSEEASDGWSDLEETLFQALLAKRPGKDATSTPAKDTESIDSARSLFGSTPVKNTRVADSPHSAFGSIPAEDTQSISSIGSTLGIPLRRTR
ncbi:uncharacterized protein NECHADRAFT_85138 [Fusarium vanettenii 77-13-4]|uniref:Uncharacterized protein n=1 Tax=Fusarium vanettenii (strain ATCC MYA-4622 / CBS 123669 / FGSC 9596 / NRRL 45880 / 77-13-4) TaxID=660122 RepID=C7YV36_FUSV7|nr:uncharacterized protein NECHADRAFT_85138 [Fusarium vanettenii 77-13-4]EEU44512.1 hypothetical protein NECHADRAFT_85138 [Fusarium vanettenii 77-13-4]